MDYLTIDVHDRQSFTAFLRLLLNDFEQHKVTWENNRLDLFLSAMARYTLDLDKHYENIHSDLNAESPTWRTFADILRSSVVYE